MKRPNEKIEHSNTVENRYVLKYDNIIIEMEYSENNKTFNECIKNILKRKVKSY